MARQFISVGPPAVAVLKINVRALVIGGAGRAAPLFRMLGERGVQVMAGVLHGTDTDDDVAARLDLERVSVPPFSAIDDASADAWRRLAAGADVIVVCDPPVGPGNVRNLELALEAARAGTRTMLLDANPIDERDFTEGRAVQLWAELARHARRVRTYDEAVDAVLHDPAGG